MGVYSMQSSAKSLAQEMRLSGRSLMYTKKSRGPRPVPSGTPDVTATAEEDVPFITTCWVLFVRKFSNHVAMEPRIP